MKICSVEHARAAYRADFAPSAPAGLPGWSAIGYGLHRFVPHGIAPFSRWHALHHHAAEPACCGVTSAFWDHVVSTP